MAQTKSVAQKIGAAFMKMAGISEEEEELVEDPTEDPTEPTADPEEEPTDTPEEEPTEEPTEEPEEPTDTPSDDLPVEEIERRNKAMAESIRLTKEANALKKAQTIAGGSSLKKKKADTTMSAEGRSKGPKSAEKKAGMWLKNKLKERYQD